MDRLDVAFSNSKTQTKKETLSVIFFSVAVNVLASSRHVASNDRATHSESQRARSVKHVYLSLCMPVSSLHGKSTRPTASASTKVNNSLTSATICHHDRGRECERLTAEISEARVFDHVHVSLIFARRVNETNCNLHQVTVYNSLTSNLSVQDDRC